MAEGVLGTSFPGPLTVHLTAPELGECVRPCEESILTNGAHLKPARTLTLCSAHSLGRLCCSNKSTLFYKLNSCLHWDVAFPVCSEAEGGQSSRGTSVCLGLGRASLSHPLSLSPGLHCNASVDLIGTCWPRSPAGQLVVRPCPAFFYGVRYNTTSKEGKEEGGLLGAVAAVCGWEKYSNRGNTPRTNSALCWLLWILAELTPSIWPQRPQFWRS